MSADLKKSANFNLINKFEMYVISTQISVFLREKYLRECLNLVLLY